MIRNEDLLRRLAGRRVCWFASCMECDTRPEYAFADLLIGHDAAHPCVKEPEVFLHTDHRVGLEASLVFPWEERSYASDNPNAIIKAANVHRVADLGVLDGYSGAIDQDFGHRFDNPEFGHAVECRVTLWLHGGSTITRTVIFVCAETVEFALKFLIPNETRIATLWQWNYHAGFNCCLTNGIVLRRLAFALGTRWYYDGEQRIGVQGSQIASNKCVLEKFPEIERIAPVALVRVPELDCRLLQGCDSEADSTEEAWVVGQTGESAIHTAAVLGVLANGDVVEGPETNCP